MCLVCCYVFVRVFDNYIKAGLRYFNHSQGFIFKGFRIFFLLVLIYRYVLYCFSCCLGVFDRFYL